MKMILADLKKCEENILCLLFKFNGSKLTLILIFAFANSFLMGEGRIHLTPLFPEIGRGCSAKHAYGAKIPKTIQSFKKKEI